MFIYAKWTLRANYAVLGSVELEFLLMSLELSRKITFYYDSEVTSFDYFDRYRSLLLAYTQNIVFSVIVTADKFQKLKNKKPYLP